MNYLAITTLAFVLNGVAILISKFLLSKSLSHPLSYVFYVSVYSLVIFILFPYLWVTHAAIPGVNTITLASLSTVFWTLGLYFMYCALRIGVADRVAPTIGVLNPVFLIVYYFLIDQAISLNQTWGAILMVAGLLFLILPYLRTAKGHQDEKIKLQEILFEILSGLFFAVSYIMLKEVFNHTDFISGMIYSKFVTVPLVVAVPLIPKLKKLVFSTKGDQINFLSKIGVIFLIGQIAGGISQILVNYAVSLANPALVNSLQGVQYVFLFIASLFLANRYPKAFPEHFNRRTILIDIFGIGLVAFGLYILAFANVKPAKVTLGITYSPRYAVSLGLDPIETYQSIFRDLAPKTIRLPVYWDEVQPDSAQNFDFTSEDYYVNTAGHNHASVTLAIGYKVPRYPECYIPNWASKLDKQQFDQALYNEIRTVVNHYKNNSAIGIWQVENEILFPFGICPESDYNRLKQEVAIVHQLDPTRPVMVTESGEFGLWLTTAKTADIVGTSLYRRTLAPYATWFKSPLPPFFYQLKANIVHLFFPNKKIFVSELQAEPWSDRPLTETSYDYQKAAFPVEDLADSVQFSEEAGFNTVYLWGVEWWYYLSKLNHPEYLNNAAMIFKDSN